MQRFTQIDKPLLRGATEKFWISVMPFDRLFNFVPDC
jgi:hypothetical protein